MIRADQFSIWITLECEKPDLEDIAKAQCELEDMAIKYQGKVGIGFTPSQWRYFLNNLSRFESRFANVFATDSPVDVMGFPVRLIEERKRF